MTPPADEHWMQQALALAERGRGWVEPNPLVGAVVVRDGRLVGSGWHPGFGGPHAEVQALAEAGAAARGATLYVTLEPCCHHGKTPPCTDAVLRAGVRRVVAAMLDPFPRVAGQGAALLRQAGVDVEVGVEEAAARRLNAAYLKLLAAGRPWVIAKWAMSLDGKIATRTGASRWISGEASRRWVHALRGRMDAIVVGIGTVLADDPLLTARPPGPRTPIRIVLDSQGRIPPSCRLVQTAPQVPVIVASTEAMGRGGDVTLTPGMEWLLLPSVRQRPSPLALLDELGRRRLTNVLVEGGGEVLGSFIDAGAVDEVCVFIAPMLIGGRGAPAPVAGEGVAELAESLRLGRWTVETLETDILLHGWRDAT